MGVEMLFTAGGAALLGLILLAMALLRVGPAKAKRDMFLGIGSVLLVVGGFAGGIPGIGGSGSLGTLAAGVPSSQAVPESALSAEELAFCSQDAQPDLVTKFIDEQTPGTTNYRNGTAVIIHAGGERVISDATGTLQTGNTLSNVLRCGAPSNSLLYIEGASNATNSLSDPIVLTPRDQLKTKNLDIYGVTRYSQPMVRARDMELEAYMFETLDAVSTDFEIMASTGINFTSTTNNATNLVVAADDDIRIGVDIDTQLADSFIGTEALACFDTSGAGTETDWDENTLVVTSNALSVTDVTSSMDEDDRQALIAYEKCYEFAPVDIKAGQKAGPFGDVEKRFEFQIRTGAGVNAAQDIQIRLVPKGDYRDEDDATKMRTHVGFRNNGATRSPIAQFQNHLINFQID